MCAPVCVCVCARASVRVRERERHRHTERMTDTKTRQNTHPHTHPRTHARTHTHARAHAHYVIAYRGNGFIEGQWLQLQSMRLWCPDIILVKSEKEKQGELMVVVKTKR